MSSRSGYTHDSGDIVGDRYRVKRYVGEGGMQEVFKASDLLLSRDVALKVPKNESAMKRFKRSAIVSARVNHANVAKTLDYLEEGARAYLIEEYVVGKDLSRVLREYLPILDPLMAARVLHRLAKGLAASHHATVVHRDLKPSNIMVVGGEKFTEVKITDFGIAKMAEEELVEAVEGGELSLTASNTAIGALPYMAPEMIQSIKDAGMPADIWSLGALLFELISGDKPFGAGYRAVPAILSGKVPPIPEVIKLRPQFKPAGEEVYEIVTACLNIDPTKRPTADTLVQWCEKLCYPNTEREFGTIKTYKNRYWGFITPEQGKGVFFHIESIFGKQKLSVGDRVWFGRHLGGGNDRAFPVLKVVTCH
jgi:eukaryotic-like serine/threonine-protein kinase